MLVYLQMVADEKEKLKFIDVYERYRGLMFYMANKILRNEMDAEDAVHEAFCAIAKNIKKFSLTDANKTKSLAVIIVRNKAIDIYNENKKRGAVEWDEAWMTEECPPPGDDGVGDAMARLPEKHRDVLFLKYSCGYRSREIGAMLGLSEGAVRQRLMKAREALKKELEKEMSEP